MLNHTNGKCVFELSITQNLCCWELQDASKARPRRLEDASSRLKDASIRLRRVVQCTQYVFKRCCWSIYHNLWTMYWRRQCFCKLKDASKMLEGIFKLCKGAFKTLQHESKTLHDAFKRCCWNGKVENGLFESYITHITVFASSKTHPRRVQEPSKHLKMAWRHLQDALKTLQAGSEVLSNASKMPSKGVINITKQKAWFLNCPLKHVTVFASSKTHPRCFKAPSRCFKAMRQDPSKRLKDASRRRC